MTQAFVSVVIPFRAAREARVNDLLDRLGAIEGDGRFAHPPQPAGLGNAARRALRQFVHFMSMVVIPADGAPTAHLVIEICADGAPDDVLARLVQAMAGVLREVIAETGNAAPGGDAALTAYLAAQRLEVGTRLFANPGLVFTGTPEMSVRRIRAERLLALRLRRILERDDAPGGSAMQRLYFARREIFASSGMKWAFVSEPVALLAPAQSRFALAMSLTKAALRDYLWVLLLPPLAAGLWSLLRGNAVFEALWHLLGTLLLELLLVAILAFLAYKRLRRQEEDDVPYDTEPDRRRIEEILARENLPGIAQNHLTGVSVLKPGFMRKISLRVALWLIAELQRGLSRPGFLNRIGTIHFARWLLLPGTDRLVFLSNYDGSWQSYLEDFIARLREGLTSVWSNTRDFPKTENLFIGGAGDGTRFKRWARRQQVPTRFWYSAYPQLTTDRIRSNAAIRHGFAGAATETQAAEWLAQFGYAAPENIEKEEISALAFGGLPEFEHAHCLLIHFSEQAEARAWARGVSGLVGYGEHVQLEDRTLIAAFTADGLRALGLDECALDTFPAAFQQGMTAPGRARALGDGDTRDWLWGGQGAERGVHAALILYARSAADLREYLEEQRLVLAEHGHRLVFEVPLRRTGRVNVEPFGFRDGVSQPIMRGSKQWAKAEDAMHVVEPGELVLGYRDNLGNLSPTPCDRGDDLGRNSSFLVIRQLEQHVQAFRDYVAAQAAALRNNPRAPGFEGADFEHWIAARMVGRWRDGSSLVRYQHPPPQERAGAPAGLAAPRPGERGSEDWRPDNDFQFGREDPVGMRCPLGAHIRRANPRDSFDPGSETQLSITNRHRILRVGRVYEPANGADPGLLFMCVNADIERQFEFLQQTWILGQNFHGLDDEIDPLVGHRGPRDSMSIPMPRGPLRLRGLARFVTTRGGGYFFLPSRSALRALSD